MSLQALLSHNKILAYFTLDPSINTQKNTVLTPTTYPKIIYHNHYPVIYFEQLYQHFLHCLPKGNNNIKLNPGNLRIYLGEKLLPVQLPMGLFIKESTVNLVVKVDLELCLLDAFKIVKNSWKKAFQVINPNQKCDYVKSRLSRAEQQQKYKLYKQGLSHGLQKQGKYQGTILLIKGLYKDVIIQRKYSTLQYKKMKEVAKQLFSLTDQQISSEKIKIFSFNFAINLDLSTKVFLDQWSYNDGYCYLVLQDCQERR